MGARLFHADGETDRQTDMMKLTFHIFVNGPTKQGYEKYSADPSGHCGDD
jgi:hypothetical protein